MAKKQTLKDIQDAYTEKLDRVKANAIKEANEKNAALVARIKELEAQLEDK